MTINKGSATATRQIRLSNQFPLRSSSSSLHYRTASCILMPPPSLTETLLHSIITRFPTQDYCSHQMLVLSTNKSCGGSALWHLERKQINGKPPGTKYNSSHLHLRNNELPKCRERRRPCRNLPSDVLQGAV